MNESTCETPASGLTDALFDVFPLFYLIKKE